MTWTFATTLRSIASRQVMHAPELDDLHDTDDLIPLRLAVPSQFRPNHASDAALVARAYRASHTDVEQRRRRHRRHRH